MTRPFLLALLGVLLFCGCSSNNVVLSEEQQLTREFEQQLAQQSANNSAMRVLAKKAQMRQHWQLVWQIQVTLCQREKDNKNRRYACDRAYWALNQLEDKEQHAFFTYVTVFNSTGEAAFYERAVSAAQSDLQKLQLTLSVGKMPDAESMQLIDSDTVEWATWFYLKGKQAGDLEMLSKSQSLYAKHGWQQHNADVLFLMAKIANEQGQRDLAFKYASLSLLVLDSLDNQDALSSVKNWLDVAQVAR